MKDKIMQKAQSPVQAQSDTDFLQISPPYRIETRRQNCYYQILRKQKGARALKRCNENSMIHWLRNLLCSVLIGAGAILPGVSGGVLAVVFDIYRPFMEVLTHPTAALPKYWRWLPPLGIGWCIGFLGLARGISASMDWSDAVTTWLFIGLIVGTIPSLFREAGKEGRGGGAWVSLAVCAAAVFFGLFYVQHVLKITVEPNFWWYNFCGVLWGMGIVIPGMTSSSVMMALGLYQPMMDGLARMDFVVLSACLPGLAITVVLLARGVTWLFRRHYAVAFHGILGAVAASTLAIIPSEYTGGGEAALSALLCLGGFALAYALDRLDQRIRT